jgi:hypothetical protein
MNLHACRQVHASFGGFSRDGAGAELNRETFLAELVGVQDFVEVDSRVLTWLVQCHMNRFRWPDYPVAGMP